MGSQLNSFLHCTDNLKCVHYGNYSRAKNIDWRQAKMITNLFLFGKPSECRYHSLRSDRGKHSLGSEIRTKHNKFSCECVDFWVLQETKKRKEKKKKTNE